MAEAEALFGGDTTEEEMLDRLPLLDAEEAALLNGGSPPVKRRLFAEEELGKLLIGDK